MLNNKTFLKVFSLVAAVLLWMYVMIEVDPQTSEKINDVSVSFAHEEELAERGLAAIMKEEPDLSVRIYGDRSDVNEIRKAGLTAYVDVSTCGEGENSRSIVVNVPDGITVESVSEEYLTFEVEEIAEEEKPLTVKFEKGISADDDKAPWIISTEYEQVTVSGAKSLVNKVSEVTGEVSADGISANRSIWVNADVRAVDSEGREVEGITVQNDESISVEIRLLDVKTVSLTVSAVGTPEGFEVEGLDRDIKIGIAGTAAALRNIEELSGTVDLSDIDDTEPHKIDVDVELPYGIYLYDEDAPAVRVTLTAAE